MKKTVRIIIIFAIILFSNCQKIFSQDSSRIRISLLTCTPGEELYSIFGHSAIRIIDSNNVTDYIYNYGTFNFDDNGFYLKFIRGKLLYFVSIERTEDFLAFYTLENRGIAEQILQLTGDEKIAIQKALKENLKEENKYYKYDFFLDNCTTRLRDVISNKKYPKPLLPLVMPASTTYRNAIHQYLDKGGQKWSELGIDILLGMPTDKIMTASEQQFLPDNLMTTIDSCKNILLVKEKTTLYSPIKNEEKKDWTTPMNCFSLLLLIIVLLSLSKNITIQKLLPYFDFMLFFCVGILGLVLILMWCATDHSMTKNNFNLCWALPTHVYASFLIFSKKRFAKKYFLFTSILMAALLLLWFVLPQELNMALIPIVLLIGLRSYQRSKS